MVGMVGMLPVMLERMVSSFDSKQEGGSQTPNEKGSGAMRSDIKDNPHDKLNANSNAKPYGMGLDPGGKLDNAEIISNGSEYLHAVFTDTDTLLGKGKLNANSNAKPYGVGLDPGGKLDNVEITSNGSEYLHAVFTDTDTLLGKGLRPGSGPGEALDNVEIISKDSEFLFYPFTSTDTILGNTSNMGRNSKNGEIIGNGDNFLHACFTATDALLGKNCEPQGTFNHVEVMKNDHKHNILDVPEIFKSNDIDSNGSHEFCCQTITGLTSKTHGALYPSQRKSSQVVLSNMIMNSIPIDQASRGANMYEYDPPKMIGSFSDATIGSVQGHATLGNTDETIIGGLPIHVK